MGNHQYTRMAGVKDYSWMGDGGNSDVLLSVEMQQSYQAAAERSEASGPLHVIDRFPIQQEQWDYMVRSTVAPCGKLEQGFSVFDAGCGAGAYLDSLLRQAPELNLRVSGVDFAPGLIDIAKHRLPAGSQLTVGDARDYKHVKSDSFDLALSFGVFFYFDNENDVTFSLNSIKGFFFLGRGVDVCVCVKGAGSQSAILYLCLSICCLYSAASIDNMHLPTTRHEWLVRVVGLFSLRCG